MLQSLSESECGILVGIRNTELNDTVLEGVEEKGYKG